MTQNFFRPPDSREVSPHLTHPHVAQWSMHTVVLAAQWAHKGAVTLKTAAGRAMTRPQVGAQRLGSGRLLFLHLQAAGPPAQRGHRGPSRFRQVDVPQMGDGRELLVC